MPADVDSPRHPLTLQSYSPCRTIFDSFESQLGPSARCSSPLSVLLDTLLQYHTLPSVRGSTPARRVRYPRNPFALSHMAVISSLSPRLV